LLTPGKLTYVYAIGCELALAAGCQSGRFLGAYTLAKINSTLRTRARKPKKPKKPYPEFPLFPHATGRWCKKIKGAFHCFGPWDDWQAALQRWEAEKVDLLAGLKPAARREKDGESTMRDLANRFLAAKESRVVV
jgi:hypothetical protein